METLRHPGFLSRLLLTLFLLAGWLTACQVETEIPTDTISAPGSMPIQDPLQTHFLEKIDSVSINRVGLAEPAVEEYQFAVVGHIYGSFEEGAPHPAATLMDSLPILKGRNVRLMVSLGDMVRNASAEDFEDLERELLGQVDFPVINAVGNHDMRDRELYQSRYGMTYYAFQYGPSEMIVLDTELDLCQISGTQRGMLEQAVEQAVTNPDVRQIFIFMHKALFANDEILYNSQSAIAMPNEWKCYSATNYPDVIESILIPAAGLKPVFVFAGDVGAMGGNLSPFYHADEDAHLTQIAVGIGDKPQDVALLVSVKDAQVTFEVMSLTGGNVSGLADYNLEYWRGVAQK